MHEDHDASAAMIVVPMPTPASACGIIGEPAIADHADQRAYSPETMAIELA